MEKYRYGDVDKRGRVERVDYFTTGRDGKTIAKYANVYLPCGYDAKDLETKYDVFYVMHGGGGNPDAFLDSAPLKNMLDSSIASGRIKPMIMVFPSYYKQLKRELRKPGSTEEKDETLFFQTELVEDLIPAVEGRYHTYAKNVTPEGIKASRMHRGFSGFSMGGCTTWYALLENIDNMAWFAPLSGDCWVIEVKGGLSRTKETAQAVADRVKASGYKQDEFFIYAATGTKDIAYEALTAQMLEMKKHTDVFTENNLKYLLVEGEEHTYEAVFQYLYNILPEFFR